MWFRQLTTTFNFFLCAAKQHSCIALELLHSAIPSQLLLTPEVRVELDGGLAEARTLVRWLIGLLLVCCATLFRQCEVARVFFVVLLKMCSNSGVVLKWPPTSFAGKRFRVSFRSSRTLVVVKLVFMAVGVVPLYQTAVAAIVGWLSRLLLSSLH